MQEQEKTLTMRVITNPKLHIQGKEISMTFLKNGLRVLWEKGSGVIGGEGDWGPRGKGAGVPIREGLGGAGTEGLGSLGWGGGRKRWDGDREVTGSWGRGLWFPGQGHGYCWLEDVRGHFVETAQLESLLPISLHYKTGPLFQNEGAILKIKGQFCPWPLPKLSLQGDSREIRTGAGRGVPGERGRGYPSSSERAGTWSQKGVTGDLWLRIRGDWVHVFPLDNGPQSSP